MEAGPGTGDRFSASAPARIAAVIGGLAAVAALAVVLDGRGLSPDLIVGGFLGLVLVVTAVIAFTARSGRANDHLLAGEALWPVAGGLATAALFALPATVLLPGLVHQHGFDGLIPLVGIAGGLVALLAIVGPALARAGAATLPELIGLRFGRLARGLTLLLAVLTTAGLLHGSLAAGTSLAARVFDRPIAEAALAFTAGVLLLVLPGGMRSTAWTGIVFYVVGAVALIGGLAIVGASVFANPVPQLAYGTALREIAPAEVGLIEAGLVDFGVFKPFLREFLTVDRLNWALLALALMAGIAALPPLVHMTRTVRGPTATRRGIAWTLTFVILLLTAVPGLAALARLEVYRVVAAGTPFAELPDWLRRASDRDALRVHGASLGMVEDAARAVAEGADSIEALAATMADRGPAQERTWQRLDPSVQEAVLSAARATAQDPSSSGAERWTRFAATVLPVAARAAGNETGKPDLAAIALDPQTLTLALPHAAGLPAAFTAVAVAGVLGAALALAACLVTTLAGLLAHDGAGVLRGAALADRTHVAVSRLLACALTAAAAATVVLVPMPADIVLVTSLSLAAAGLLPALVLAIWWPRANVWGFLAALVTGLGLGIYYLAGTSLYSVTFYDAWSVLSNAGPDAFDEFEELKALWIAAEGDARAAAYADLAARAGGGLWSPGLANWFGIAPAAAATLAIPAALIAGILVSFVTPRPTAGQRALHARLHGWRSRDEAEAAAPPEPGGG